METRRRTIEAYRLTFSGLDPTPPYERILRKLRPRNRTLASYVHEFGSKSHALYGLQVRAGCAQLKFLSFTTGYRPDVLDTTNFRISPNPLTERQTGVEWTHALGGQVGNRYVLLIERVQAGISASRIEHYLQLLADRTYPLDDDDEERVTVSLEPEPSQSFIERINSLERISKATVRTIRPNPGWADLESELGVQADESNAQKADVTMTPPRNQSLEFRTGIVAAIRDLFDGHELTFAAVEGQRTSGGAKERFSTEKLIVKRSVMLKIDDRGQVESPDAWKKMGEILDQLE